MVALILLVVEVPDQPVGKVQLYSVAVTSFVREYTPLDAATTVVKPLILLGVEGVGFTVTVDAILSDSTPPTV